MPDAIRLVKNEEGVVLADSREVALRFGKRHDNVLRAIEDLKTQAPQAALNFEDTPFIHPQNGKTYRYCLMTRDGFSLLVMGFTGHDAIVWKLKFLNAFTQMERKLEEGAIANLNNPEVLRGLLLNYTEKVLSLESKVGELQPAAEAMGMLRSAKGAVTMTAVAKMLEVSRPWLFDVMTEEGWFYKQNGHHLPYATTMRKGWFTVDPAHSKPILRSSGAVELKATTLVTAKGLSEITAIVRNRLEAQKERQSMLQNILPDNGVNPEDDEDDNSYRNDTIYGMGDD